MEKVSFSDESKSGRRLWYNHIISTPIQPNNDLHWFYLLFEIAKRKNSFLKEMKANVAIKVLREVDKKTKNKIWDSLQKVTIIVEDPKHYLNKFGFYLDSFNEFYFKFNDFKRKLEENTLLFEIFEHRVLEHIFKFISEDPPVVNIDRAIDSIEENKFSIKKLELPKIYNKRFDNNLKIQKKIEIASLVTVRLIIAFFEIIDPVTAHQVQKDFEICFVSDPYFFYVLNLACKAILVKRIFDEGDSRSIDVIQKSSKSVIELIKSCGMQIPNQEIIELDSRKSDFLQASDVASGIARNIYENLGLERLKEIFSKIILNGKII